VNYSDRLLVFTRTAGYRHESIPAGVTAIRAIAADLNLTVTATEDPADLSRRGLDGCAAVVFLNSIGGVLTDEARAALTAFLRAGGAFVGVHAAAATEPDWPYFRAVVGARFVRHPDIARASVRVVFPNHPATDHLGPIWDRVDEWYDFDAPPDPGTRVLLALDESTYPGGGMGAHHPIAWCHEHDGARCFYTAGGHTVEAYSEPAFLRHLRGGLLYATGLDLRT
jgi:type 1 glutamine amidotransferase